MFLICITWVTNMKSSINVGLQVDTSKGKVLKPFKLIFVRWNICRGKVTKTRILAVSLYHNFHTRIPTHSLKYNHFGENAVAKRRRTGQKCSEPIAAPWLMPFFISLFAACTKYISKYQQLETYMWFHNPTTEKCISFWWNVDVSDCMWFSFVLQSECISWHSQYDNFRLA